MTKPSGKLEFAYRTIAALEQKLEAAQARVAELEIRLRTAEFVAGEFAPVAQAGQVPDGWKLVPIEPTEWPLEAGVKAYNAAVKSGCEQIDCIYDALHEMLAAAPAQGE